MRPGTEDRTKIIIGWMIVLSAVLAAILCLLRDSVPSLVGCAIVGFVGWTFVSDAKKGRPSRGSKRFRWFHALLIVGLLVLAVVIGYFGAR